MATVTPFAVNGAHSLVLRGGGLFRLPKRGSRTENRNVECAGRKKFESFTRFSTLRFSLPDPDFWQSILECVFSLGFGRFVLEKWQLSHGFAVDVP